MSRNPKSLALGLGHEAAPAFMAWFSGSKIVDPSGAPLVVYHGTGDEFAVFCPSEAAFYGRGIYLTDDPLAASEYADEAPAGAPSVLPVFVLAQNPYVFKSGYAIVEPTAVSLIKKVLRGDSKKRALTTFNKQGRLTDELEIELTSRGHDGLIVRVPDEPDEIIVFSPEQIKSAIGNNGQYSPENPDIRYSSTPSYRERAQ
jgi:hypothetical protein